MPYCYGTEEEFKKDFSYKFQIEDFYQIDQNQTTFQQQKSIILPTLGELSEKEKNFCESIDIQQIQEKYDKILSLINERECNIKKKFNNYRDYLTKVEGEILSEIKIDGNQQEKIRPFAKMIDEIKNLYKAKFAFSEEKDLKIHLRKLIHNIENEKEALDSKIKVLTLDNQTTEIILEKMDILIFEHLLNKVDFYKDFGDIKNIFLSYNRNFIEKSEKLCLNKINGFFQKETKKIENYNNVKNTCENELQSAYQCLFDDKIVNSITKLMVDYQKTIHQLKETVSTNVNLDILTKLDENLSSIKSSIQDDQNNSKNTLNKMGNVLSEKETKLNQIITSFLALNPTNFASSEVFLNKLQSLTTKYEALLGYPKLIFKTIDQYILYNNDNSDVSYSGMVFCPYSSSCINIEELKNNNLGSGVGLQSGIGCLIIEKNGTFNELILGGNNSVPGGWGTHYWNNVTILFIRGFELVAVFKLTSANSDGSKWNSVKMDNLNITKMIITGYCSFSKIAFK